MKLAREIAYAVASYEAELGKSASSYDIEPIIAEKLRPIRDALAMLLQDSGTPGYCEWVQEDPFGSGDSCIWQTECGHEFVFDEGTPSDNGAEFCLYCGKKLVERVVENDE